MKTYLTILIGLLLLSCKEKTYPPLELTDSISISEIQEAFKTKRITISELTQFYLHRIDSLDSSGPNLNSVITVNPDALDIAKDLDEELSKGTIRSPLHGIPVLLKDNINTKDKMPCTAGARVMAKSFPLEDKKLTHLYFV